MLTVQISRKAKLAQKIKEERNALAKKINVKQEEKTDIKQADSNTAPKLKEVYLNLVCGTDMS